MQDQAWDLAQLFLQSHFVSRTNEQEAAVGISNSAPGSWVWVPGGSHRQSQGWSSCGSFPSHMYPFAPVSLAGLGLGSVPLC